MAKILSVLFSGHGVFYAKIYNEIKRVNWHLYAVVDIHRVFLLFSRIVTNVILEGALFCDIVVVACDIFTTNNNSFETDGLSAANY